MADGTTEAPPLGQAGVAAGEPHLMSPLAPRRFTSLMFDEFIGEGGCPKTRRSLIRI